MGLLLAQSSLVIAQSARSDNYQATDMQFESMNAQEACSGEYCALVTLGSGLRSPARSSSLTYSTLRDDEPQLDIAIRHGTTDLGDLSIDRPATKTVNITVRNHLTGGYMLYVIGEPLKIGDHTLEALTKPAKSRPGKEQFGINLVSNGQPAIGQTMKSQRLSKGSTSKAEVSEDYAVHDKFKFKSGDIIASSTADSGRDNYTVSMIVNISSATPPGKYDGGFAIMAVPGF